MVKNTIAYILHLFFHSKSNALVSIYDSVDGKQHCRKRLFERWFNEFNDGTLVKIDGTFFIDNEETYAISIYSSGHTDEAIIQMKFKELLQVNFYNE